MKICILGDYHHKNIIGLRLMINYLRWTIVNSIEEADIVMSSNVEIDTRRYTGKKFIFGPHFSVFPNEVVKRLSGGIYIQPSEQVVNLWVKEFEFTGIPVKSLPFPVDTGKFVPAKEKTDEVFIYFKRRDPEELKRVVQLFANIKHHIFVYGSYSEQNYANIVSRCRYGVWIGTHESQGFALEEALSMNTPLLVWDVTSMKQEYGQYQMVDKPLALSTAPYWDNSCGMKVYSYDELVNRLEEFVVGIPTKNPRQFILDTLSVDDCAYRLMQIYKELC